MSDLVDGRCWWGASTPEYVAYHDEEWGRPVRDSRALYEKLSLEAFQSGLSWLTILRKRENFRAAFAGFQIERVASFDEQDFARLMADAGIVRNRAKIEATVTNARRFGDLVAERGSFASYAWSFAPKPRRRLLSYAELSGVKAGAEAVAMSQDLRRRGWSFVGPVTVHSFMEAMGLVNDHVQGCAAGAECLRERRAFSPPGQASITTGSGPPGRP